MGYIDEAYAAAFSCLLPGPASPAAVTFLCDLIENYPIPASIAPTPAQFASALALDGLDLRLIARAALAVATHRAPLNDILVVARRDGFAAAARLALTDVNHALLRDANFSRALSLTPNVDPAIELLLSEIRRSLALEPHRLANPAVTAFTEILARQCDLNGYVFYAAEDEFEHLDHPILRHLYPQPSTAPTRAPISDDVSGRVARQYEEHPYPIWTQVNVPVEGTQLAQLRAIQTAHGLPHTPDAPNVFIPGCGTGQQVIQLAAGLGPDARILACDLSAASLDYATAKAAEYGLTGIEFLQADLLDLGNLDRRFDIVSCTGVLHHLRDPRQGWRILTDLLAPSGVQYIALYSAHARASLDDLRRCFPADTALPVVDRIRRFRRRVIETYVDNWRASGIVGADFFTLGGCRDLLFHEQETRYTIPQIADDLDSLGLRLLDFVTPSSVGRAFAEAYPGAARDDLATWDAFERARPDTFRQMYQFWCAPTDGTFRALSR